jgi:hypothetical protein
MKPLAFLLAIVCAVVFLAIPCAADALKPTTAPADAKADPGPAQATTAPAPTSRPAKSPAAKPSGPLTGTAAKIDFSDAALSTVLDFLRDVSGANMHVNWHSLEAAGITKDTPISVKATDITVSKGLNMVLEQINGGKSKMDSVYWIVDEGVVTVATGTAINGNLTTKVIDVGDLLLTVPTFTGPRIDMTAANQSSSSGTGTSGSGGGGGGQSVFGSTTTNQEESSADAKKRTQDSLIKIVKDSIGQDMWAPDGKGSISFLGTKLVISQTQLGFKLLEMNATAK